MKRCIHCQIVPANPHGSTCWPCWLTAPNRHSGQAHTAVSECPCWLSHYATATRERWAEAMRDAG